MFTVNHKQKVPINRCLEQAQVVMTDPEHSK